MLLQHLSMLLRCQFNGHEPIRHDPRQLGAIQILSVHDSITKDVYGYGVVNFTVA